MTAGEKELSAICQKWDRTIADNNVLEMVRFMAPDWVLVGSKGGITSKSRFLEVVKTGIVVHNLMDFEEIRIKIYDDTAVVTSKGISAGTMEGKSFRFYEWSTSTFIRRNNQWKCVMTVLTPAMEK